MLSTTNLLPHDQIAERFRAYRRLKSQKRLQLWIGVVCMLFLFAGSLRATQFDFQQLWENGHRFLSYFYRIAHLDDGQPVWTNVAEWMWGVLPEYRSRWLWSLLDTVLIAYIGTLLGGLGGLFLCFYASENLGTSRLGVWLARRILEFCRSVPEIVFALIFVAAFGLGALPGILAIAIHSAGALGKLFSETVENIDMKPVDGLVSVGATWWEANRYAVLPQVASSFTGYALWRFEINVRSAAVMGFVGAGGIGQDLIEYIRKFYYSDVSALLVLIVALVMAIDFATGRLRHRLIDGSGARAA